MYIAFAWGGIFRCEKLKSFSKTGMEGRWREGGGLKGEEGVGKGSPRDCYSYLLTLPDTSSGFSWVGGENQEERWISPFVSTPPFREFPSACVRGGEIHMRWGRGRKIQENSKNLQSCSMPTQFFFAPLPRPFSPPLSWQAEGGGLYPPYQTSLST